jgi:hypothetical protein
MHRAEEEDLPLVLVIREEKRDTREQDEKMPRVQSTMRAHAAAEVLEEESAP